MTRNGVVIIFIVIFIEQIVSKHFNENQVKIQLIMNSHILLFRNL